MTTTESYYFPGSAPYLYSPAPTNITETYVSPVPHVNEVQINELLPFRATPTYTINNWVVRSNVSDRGALANSMLLVWRPEDMDYGSDVDTTTLPQAYLFTNDRERVNLQRRLYTNYPELNLQSYALRAPVRINTHLSPNASLIGRNTLLIPAPDAPTVIVPTEPAQYESITYPPELYGVDGLMSPYATARVSKKRSSRKRASK